jgi:hypothetical protein
MSSWKGIPGKKLLILPFEPGLIPSDYKVDAEIRSSKGTVYVTTTELIVLNHKSNEVKTDRLTGGLIVNRRAFIPFGFYCYSPVYPTLPEEEVVKGFNMTSPYHLKHLKKEKLIWTGVHRSE